MGAKTKEVSCGARDSSFSYPFSTLISSYHCLFQWQIIQKGYQMLVTVIHCSVMLLGMWLKLTVKEYGNSSTWFCETT